MQHELKLWEFISGSDFKIPSSPTKETARGQSRRLWHWLKHDVLTQVQSGASSDAKKLETPSAENLEIALIEPDWGQAARSLSADFREWFNSSQADHRSARALIGPAGSGVTNVLHALAEERQLKILSPPPSHAILADVESYKMVLQSLDEPVDDFLVIPHLERFYYRHEDGLNLIRKVVERLMSRRRVLIGCDSWAWAFLQQAIGIEDMLGQPMTAAPFDDQRLDSWFRSHYDLREIDFRQSQDDKPVFLPRPERSASDSKEAKPETSDLIKSLAARARGNLGVALSLWRCSLRTGGSNSAKSKPPKQTSQRVYWVESCSELELHKLTKDVDQLHRFVIHAILLHGGLSLSTLITLLPFSREEICRRVGELSTAGMLCEQNDTLRVTLSAYPEVRQGLAAEGFLVDAF